MIEDYPLILGIILLSGYFTFRLLNHFYGYYREKMYLDKLLEYSLFGTAGFLIVYFMSKILSLLLNKPFNFEEFLIYYSPLFLIASFLAGYCYEKKLGYKKREKSASIFHIFHKKVYKKGWVMVYLRDGQIFSGKLSFTDIDEWDRCIFSIRFAKKLDKKYKVIYKFLPDAEIVFDIKNILFIEYMKK